MDPQGIVKSDASVERFYRILQSAYTDITRSFTEADLSSPTTRRIQANQIKQIIAQADENVQAWIKVEVPTYYEQGMFDAMSQLVERNDRVGITQSFAKFHKEAIEALAADTYSRIAEGMSGVTRTADRLLSAGAKEQVVEQLAKGAIKGDSLQKIKKSVVDVLESEGLTALVDKKGNSWDLMRYAEMLARTKLTQAQNSGIGNRLTESGYDLVVVSNHNGSCEQCAPFEGKILSLTGRNSGYMSVDDAVADGLFHPNCRHVYSAYHEKYLDQSVAWDADKQEYIPYKDLRSLIISRNEEVLAEKLRHTSYTAELKKIRDEKK